MMSHQREITTFPLNPSVMGKLLRAGLNTVSSLISIELSTLTLSTGLSAEEAEQALKIVRGDEVPSSHRADQFTVKSALDLLIEEQEQEHIVTFCEAVDSMLGGGIPLGKLTEFCGAPGTGKTQLCMQLAVDAHIPEEFGGVAGETVYIDTEGSLVATRLAEIADATARHCQQVAATQGTPEQSSPVLTSDKILEGVHCFRCHDYYDLIATVQRLPHFFRLNKKVRLLVVDSLASPFRHNMEDMSLRRLLLASLTQSFLSLAASFKIAVVLTNQMTTKIMPREGDSHLIPALGENWAHVPHNRVVLSCECGDLRRAASLYKGSNKSETRCHFQITHDGVRDVF